MIGNRRSTLADNNVIGSIYLPSFCSFFPSLLLLGLDFVRLRQNRLSKSNTIIEILPRIDR